MHDHNSGIIYQLATLALAGGLAYLGAVSTWAGDVRPAVRKMPTTHWAFVPPRRPDLPAQATSQLARNGIDAFVLARLESEGLRASPRADRVTLIRRVTFALTGLPPTPEEVDAFLADQAPDAYERVLDRLLASPQYGEHLAWEWLDAARYADTSGYQADWERFMWPWRDWVIAAYNANMPFDQFTIEQIAGDLLPGATPSQRLATGFNRNHRINDEGGSLDAEFEVEYVVDRVDTTATVWLGLTAGCARCHDHKYDPVSQREYYQLYAFFNNVPEKGIDGRRGFANPHIEIPNKQVQEKIAELEDRLAREQQLMADAFQTSADRNAREQRIKLLATEIEKLQPAAVTPVMVMQELPEPEPTYRLNRGVYDQPDTTERLMPALPAVFGTLPGDSPNRLTLARWLVDRDNPLTARVTVNRIWQRLFGTGLVETSEDFGTRGAPPSHPLLLDWLATEFMDREWDLKAFQRLILTSATYRQRSRVGPEILQVDPGNRLLTRGPRQRLSGAAIRDAALAVSGLLLKYQGGPPVKPYQPAGLWKELSFGTGKTTVDVYVQDQGESLYRRSLYTFWKRTVAPPRLSVFDGSGREMCRVRYEVTNTPLQALTLQNDVTFVEAARHLARRVLRNGGGDVESRLTLAWRLVLARRPAPEELAVLRRSLERYVAAFRLDRDAAVRLLQYGESSRDESLDAAQHAAYTLVALSLLNLDEAIVRD